MRSMVVRPLSQRQVPDAEAPSTALKRGPLPSFTARLT